MAESTQSPEVSEGQAAQTIAAAETASAVETPATPAGEITETEAKNIALTDAGVAEADVTAIRVKLDVDHGVREYEVEFYVGNMEYDYEIDAQSGAIVSMDAEIEDDFKPSKDSKSTQKTQDIQTVETALSEDDAIAIVLDEVPDATESDVRIHLEFDDGRYVYDASVVLGLTEYELEIDANDGTVLKWEKDSIFD